LYVEEGLVWSQTTPHSMVFYTGQTLTIARFGKGNAHNNIYIKVNQYSILLIEVYVDDIIFGSDDDKMRSEFSKDMHNGFEMSLLGELSFFLDLQICQRN
jgi:hypothetical protein